MSHQGNSIISEYQKQALEYHEHAFGYPDAAMETRSDGETDPPRRSDSHDAKVLCRGFGPPLVDGDLGVLGAYRVKSLLVKGGMGSVFIGEDKTLGRPVALKVIRSDLADKASARERFLREARAAASLQHDHIVTIYHVGEEQGTLFLAMPLLSGQSLEASLKASPRPPLSEVLRIGREIAEGLAAAHAAGLIHRDIKPANVWLEGDRARVKLLDFGLARSSTAASRLTQDGLILGTPSFMSPEQVRNSKNIDQRCDLFSLGVLLYVMVTGRQPFEGPTTPELLVSIVRDEPVPPAGLRPGLPRVVNDLIMRLLSKKPADRPSSAIDVIETIAEIEDPASLSHILLEAADHPNFTLARKPPRRDHTAMGLFIALGLFAMAILIIAKADKLFDMNGKLVIESPSPYVLVAVEQYGHRVALMDLGAQNHISLRAGRYDLEIEGKSHGLRPEHGHLMIRGGESVYVRLVPKTDLDGRAASARLGAKASPLP